jgi:rhamnosyl/mannosyltransferase
MKSLQLTKFYPPMRGGIESVSYELVTGLNALGIRTDVLCANTGPRTIRETGPAGELIVRAASFGRLLSTSIAPALVVELRDLHSRYDVIHVQFPDPMANLAMRLVRPRTKLVLHWQSDVINQKRALKLYEPLQRWMLERADAIVTSSDAYARSSSWLAPYSRKVLAIPLGIQDPPKAPESEVRALLARHAGRRLVFALGRMTLFNTSSPTLLCWLAAVVSCLILTAPR